MDTHSAEFKRFKFQFLSEDLANKGYNDRQILEIYMERHRKTNKENKFEKPLVDCIECGCNLRMPMYPCDLQCPTCKRPYKVQIHKQLSAFIFSPTFEVYKAAKEGQRIHKITPEVKMAFEILGVSEFSRDDVVKSAYKKIMTDYHPDKVTHLGAEIKYLALRKSQEANEAYKLIKEWQQQ